MNSKSQNDAGRVDTRKLQSGKVRLRFKLSDDAHQLISNALPLTGYQYPASGLDAIAMNYLAGTPAVASPGFPARGSKRLLVRLWPDQYECVRDALDSAHCHVETDEEALVAITLAFLQSEPQAPEVNAA